MLKYLKFWTFNFFDVMGKLNNNLFPFFPPTLGEIFPIKKFFD